MPYRNPLLLTRKPITVKHETFGNDACAKVQTDISQRPHNSYELTIYDTYSKELFGNSPYYTVIPYRVFELGLMTHEISHVMKGTLDIDFPVRNYVADFIDNVLSDTSDEYNLMKNFPDYAKYTQLPLSCLRWDTPDSIDGTALANDLNTLYYLTRFGVIKNGADAAFVSFLLPLVLSSNRGDRENTIIAGIAIYEYLYQKGQESSTGKDNWTSAMMWGAQQQVLLSESDYDTIAAASQVMSSAALDAAQAAQQQTKLPQSGMLSGLSGPPPDDEEKDDEFYLQTCGLYADVIIGLENVFLRKRRKMLHVSSYEGELNQRYLQQAFEDSLLGEERRTYIGLRRQKPWIKALLYRDVSGSTANISVEYARAVVCFLAALENKEGVKTGLVDFNSNYNILMQFGDPVSKSRIRPTASGGTVLYPALEETQKWDWTAHEKYAIIITDRGISSWGACKSLLTQFVESGVTPLVIEIVTSYNQRMGSEAADFPGSFMTTLADLPEKLMAVLTGE